MTTTHTRTPRPDAVEHEPIPTTCTKTRCSAAPVVRFELAGSYVRYLCSHHAALDVAALARPGRRFIIDGLPEVEVER